MIVGMMAWAAVALGGSETVNSSALVPAPALGQRVLAELNRVRGAPHELVGDLTRFRGWHEGNLVRFPGREVAMITREGVVAVDDAIEAARSQQPVAPLTLSPILSQAAADHAAFLAGGHVGHDGENGSSPSDRVVRRGGGRYVGEIISFGYADPADVIRQFIVDDGVPDRGHRHAVFQGRYRYAGIACGPHARYGSTCVVTLAATPDGR